MPLQTQSLDFRCLDFNAHRRPAPNIDVHHSSNQRFIVKVVVAKSVHSKIQITFQIENTFLPYDHWQIRVVGHEGIQTSESSSLASKVFALRKKLNLVSLEIHGNADGCPTTLRLCRGLAFYIKFQLHITLVSTSPSRKN